MLVALPQTPADFAAGRYSIVPAHLAQVSAFDRSFHFGDSLYEVTRTYNGRIYALDEHMDRLKRSMELAMFEENASLDMGILRKMILDCSRAWCKTHGNHDLYIRWMVSRGVGDLNISRTTSSAPYGFVFVKRLIVPTPEDFEKGYHYIISSRIRNNPLAIDPHMKSGNYINNILALVEARAKGADDAILLDEKGFVTEGTTNNVYVIKDGAVLTAPNEAPILEGITRSTIMAEAAKSAHINIKTVPYSADDFRNADEAFMSSSIKEIMPITKIDGKPVGNGKAGPITRALAAAFKAQVAKDIHHEKNENVFS